MVKYNSKDPQNEETGGLIMKKTYIGWREADYKSKQTEYTEPTQMLAEDGTLLVKGWARHNVFDYDRYHVKQSFLHFP